MGKWFRMFGALPWAQCLLCSHHLINTIFYLCLTKKSVQKKYKVHFQRTETSAYSSSYIPHCIAQVVQQKKLWKSWRKSNFVPWNAHKRKIKINSQAQGALWASAFWRPQCLLINRILKQAWAIFSFRLPLLPNFPPIHLHNG